MRRACAMLLPVIALITSDGLPASAETVGCTSQLCELVDAGRLSDLRWSNFADYRLRIRNFYEPSGYAFAWVNATEVTPSAKAIIEVLKNANSKGLDSEDYDGSRWRDRIEALEKGETATAPIDAARFDLALTVCVMRYVSDLHFGKVDPGLFQNNLEIDRNKNDLVSFVRRRLVGASDPTTAFDSIEPPYEGYRRTLVVLQHYVVLAEEPPVEPLPLTPKPVDPGMAYPASAQLAAILRRFGDLPAEAAQAPDGLYAGALVAAVKHFQSRHGLDTDGRIGKATVAALNTPVEARVRQLQLTLERWRWVPHEFSVPPLVVNIPEFELRALDADFHT